MSVKTMPPALTIVMFYAYARQDIPANSVILRLIFVASYHVRMAVHVPTVLMNMFVFVPKIMQEMNVK